MPTIDADAHVIECEQTWSYIDNEKLRPYLISPGGGRPQNWLVDGRVFPPRRQSRQGLPLDICEMRDIKGRLKHMDELEIDVQVLYPSLFLRPLTVKAEVENAICRSYNQWLIDICKKGEGRLRMDRAGSGDRYRQYGGGESNSPEPTAPAASSCAA